MMIPMPMRAPATAPASLLQEYEKSTRITSAKVAQLAECLLDSELSHLGGAWLWPNTERSQQLHMLRSVCLPRLTQSPGVMQQSCGLTASRSGQTYGMTLWCPR